MPTTSDLRIDNLQYSLDSELRQFNFTLSEDMVQEALVKNKTIYAHMQLSAPS